MYFKCSICADLLDIYFYITLIYDLSCLSQSGYLLNTWWMNVYEIVISN